MENVTLILDEYRGDQKLLAEKLLPMVYEELRKLASRKLAFEDSSHSLQPTALVHDAWLKIVNGQQRTWQDRAHFYRAAAVAMRHILIDRARQKSTIKHGGSWQKVDIASIDLETASADEHLLLVDECLRGLEKEDPSSAEIVLLKFFTGLSNKDAAHTLGISTATAERRWAFAKVRLYQMISEQLD